MASVATDNDPDDHRTLDQLRTNFRNLHSSIAIVLDKGFLKLDPAYIVENTGLPSWNNINQTQLSVAKNLEEIEKFLAANSAFLKSTHVHPNSQFPAGHLGMVTELLRRNPGNESQRWLEESRRIGLALDEPEETPDTFSKSLMAVDEKDEAVKMSSQDWMKLWDFAAPEAQEHFKEIFLGEQGGDDDEDDFSDDNEEDGDGEETSAAKGKAKLVGNDGPPMPLEDILRYISAGGTMAVGGPPSAG